MEKTFTRMAFKDGRKDGCKIRCRMLLELLQLGTFVFPNKIPDEGAEIDSRCKMGQNIINIAVSFSGQ